MSEEQIITVDTITAPEGVLQSFSITKEGVCCHERGNPDNIFFTIPGSLLGERFLDVRKAIGRATTLPTKDVQIQCCYHANVGRLRLDCFEALDFWLELKGARYMG